MILVLYINIVHPIASEGCIPRPPASEIHHHTYLDLLSENPGSAPGYNECFRCVRIHNSVHLLIMCTYYIATYMFSYLQGLFYYIRRHIYSSKL